MNYILVLPGTVLFVNEQGNSGHFSLPAPVVTVSSGSVFLPGGHNRDFIRQLIAQLNDINYTCGPVFFSDYFFQLPSFEADFEKLASPGLSCRSELELQLGLASGLSGPCDFFSLQAGQSWCYQLEMTKEGYAVTGRSKTDTHAILLEMSDALQPYLVTPMAATVLIGKIFDYNHVLALNEILIKHELLDKNRLQFANFQIDRNPFENFFSRNLVLWTFFEVLWTCLSRLLSPVEQTGRITLLASPLAVYRPVFKRLEAAGGNIKITGSPDLRPGGAWTDGGSNRLTLSKAAFAALPGQEELPLPFSGWLLFSRDSGNLTVSFEGRPKKHFRYPDLTEEPGLQGSRYLAGNQDWYRYLSWLRQDPYGNLHLELEGGPPDNFFHVLNPV